MRDITCKKAGPHLNLFYVQDHFIMFVAERNRFYSNVSFKLLANKRKKPLKPRAFASSDNK